MTRRQCPKRASGVWIFTTIHQSLISAHTVSVVTTWKSEFLPLPNSKENLNGNQVETWDFCIYLTVMSCHPPPLPLPHFWICFLSHRNARALPFALQNCEDHVIAFFFRSKPLKICNHDHYYKRFSWKLGNCSVKFTKGIRNHLLALRVRQPMDTGGVSPLVNLYLLRKPDSPHRPRPVLSLCLVFCISETYRSADMEESVPEESM